MTFTTPAAGYSLYFLRQSRSMASYTREPHLEGVNGIDRGVNKFVGAYEYNGSNGEKGNSD